MDKQKKILETGLLILLIILGVFPIARILSSENQSTDNVIAQALSMQRLHAALQDGSEIETLMALEDAWIIEDTRTPSETPLITRMHYDGAELGYDQESRTFYCTLGMECTEEWPTLEISAGGGTGSGGENLSVAWIDDYTYDYCSDAIREGYRYELLAYNETSYEYIGIVFTGLPIVTLHIHHEDEVGEEYVPARVSVAGAGYEPIDTAALTHTRGGGYDHGIDKDAYRIEFHDEDGYGTRKNKKLSVLGMPEDSDWILLANVRDHTAVRNYLAFDMWERWNAETDAFMVLEDRLVEVFVDDEYKGIYQLIQRVKPEREIAAMGGNVDTDMLVRLVADINVGEKPTLNMMETAHIIGEYRYAPNNDVEKAFGIFKDYERLARFKGDVLSDEEFSELACRRINPDSLVSYYLFMQSCGLAIDNVFNNLFIWMIQENDEYVLYFAPWDMDGALPTHGYGSELLDDGSVKPYFDMTMTAACRMLDMNLMNSREKIWDLWNEKRSTILSDDEIYNWIMSLEEWINASGAYLRESEKWRGGARKLDLSEMIYFEQQHMNTIEWHLNEYWLPEDNEAES